MSRFSNFEAGTGVTPMEITMMMMWMRTRIVMRTMMTAATDCAWREMCVFPCTVGARALRVGVHRRRWGWGSGILRD